MFGVMVRLVHLRIGERESTGSRFRLSFRTPSLRRLRLLLELEQASFGSFAFGLATRFGDGGFFLGCKSCFFFLLALRLGLCFLFKSCCLCFECFLAFCLGLLFCCCCFRFRLGFCFLFCFCFQLACLGFCLRIGGRCGTWLPESSNGLVVQHSRIRIDALGKPRTG